MSCLLNFSLFLLTLPTLSHQLITPPSPKDTRSSAIPSLSRLTQLDLIFPRPFQAYLLPAVDPTAADSFPIVFALHDIGPFLNYSPAFDWQLFTRSNLTHEIDSGGLPFSAEDGGLNLELLAEGEHGLGGGGGEERRRGGGVRGKGRARKDKRHVDRVGKDAASTEEQQEGDGGDEEVEEAEESTTTPYSDSSSPSTFLLVNATDALQNSTASNFVLHYNLHFHNCYHASEPEFGKPGVTGFIEFNVVRAHDYPLDVSSSSPPPSSSPAYSSSSFFHFFGRHLASFIHSRSNLVVDAPDAAADKNKEEEEENDDDDDDDTPPLLPIDPIPLGGCAHRLGTVGMLGSGPSRDNVQCAIFERRPPEGEACRLNLTDDHTQGSEYAVVAEKVRSHLVAVVETKERLRKQGLMGAGEEEEEEESFGERKRKRPISGLTGWGYIMFIGLLVLA